MKLHWSPRSPFVRKVMIVLHETGQIGHVDCVRTVVAAGSPPSPDLLIDNPLGKIPTLVLDDGTCLFDSRVICEFLDARAGGRLMPGHERFKHLRWQALGDGLTETLLLLRGELQRDAAHIGLVESYRSKIGASFAAINAEMAELDRVPFGLGHIALVCAIGQLDFRFGGSRWREAFPRMASWFAGLAERASIVATVAKDDGPQGGTDTTAFLDFTKIS
ncbi:glutathione S-transferase [Tianweitania sp. Rool2]|uniref:Glutathione S-transferase n=2 Tax=Oryzicola mucosus TaxID=2767425 RepID=A0A8J6TZ17_9HYPH|nr:glutathione S-transferase [Oryzicola mucosus]MBD0415614.1 glutathione S-transferase [Oryzicola mucosus]